MRPCELKVAEKWKINRWSVFILETVLVVMILLVILPQNRSARCGLSQRNGADCNSFFGKRSSHLSDRFNLGYSIFGADGVCESRIASLNVKQSVEEYANSK